MVDIPTTPTKIAQDLMENASTVASLAHALIVMPDLTFRSFFLSGLWHLHIRYLFLLLLAVGGFAARSDGEVLIILSPIRIVTRYCIC